MNKAVFLDRDGVLNDVTFDSFGVSHPPSSLEELKILSGVDEACARLRAAGFLLVAVTNQPDVARGIQTRERVKEINTALKLTLCLDHVETCFHDDEDECNCRKPRPGMLFAASELLNINLTVSFMVGDRISDIHAGRSAGCRTILVTRSLQNRDRSHCNADYIVNDLLEASEIIIRC